MSCSGVAGAGIGAGELLGQHFGHMPSGLHQAVDLAPVLHTFADSADVRVGGGQTVIDDDGVVDRESGLFGQRALRADSCGQYHHIGGYLLAVVEHHGIAGGVGDDFGDSAAQDHAQAHILQHPRQHRPAGGIHLTFHGEIFGMYHGDLGAAQQRGACGFQSE
ncbi:Uncharacterised protein [Mycobacteroides abscessus]|nr:Uncharacterised protein [Mycobacteroides abscessus]